MTLVGATATLLGPADGPRLVWLVVAILAGELAGAWLVLTRLRRAMWPERFIEFRTLASTLLAALAMAPLAAAVWWLQQVYAVGEISNLAVLTLGGIVALGVYALVLRVATQRRTKLS